MLLVDLAVGLRVVVLLKDVARRLPGPCAAARALESRLLLDGFVKGFDSLGLLLARALAVVEQPLGEDGLKHCVGVLVFKHDVFGVGRDAGVAQFGMKSNVALLVLASTGDVLHTESLGRHDR